jgi:hypothetical protein
MSYLRSPSTHRRKAAPPRLDCAPVTALGALFLSTAVALAGAAPAAATPAVPAPPSPAALELLRAVEELERRTKDEGERAVLARAKKALRPTTTTSAKKKDAAAEPPPRPPTPTELVSFAEEIGALAPDHEPVHLAVVQSLLLTAAAGDAPAGLAPRIRARAEGFVDRNPTSTRGRDLLATALLQQGDEEGHLRALAACGEGCRARFAEAMRTWQRVRCTGEGVARGLTLRIGKDILAISEDVLYLEPPPPRPPPPPPRPGPAPASPAAEPAPEICGLRLNGPAALRLASKTDRASPETPTTLIVLEGIMLVADTRLTEPNPSGLVAAPAVVCERLCRDPLPRALPEGLLPEPPPADGAASR